MDKINPLLYIVDTDPVPEQVLDASKWFETEYITTTGVLTNTPTSASESSTYLEWFLAQGWVQYDVQYSHRSISGTTITQNVVHFLKRRKLQSERVLNDMIREFTEAYNEGRAINDQRYDELVSIYNVCLDKTETEMTNLGAVSAAYGTLIESIIGKMPEDFAAFSADASILTASYGSSRRVDVNARFDNELAKARQSLIERGLNNSTVWASVSAGIERERERALSDLEDKITDRRLSMSLKVAEARDSMRKSMLSAHERLMVARRENVLTPLEFRNRVLMAMLTFMERRQDEYPGLDGLSNLIGQLGYSESAAVVAPTA